MAGLFGRLLARVWAKIFSSSLLTLNGYVAFNLPRAVTGLGTALLMGLVAVHVYVLASTPVLPLYFVIYAAVLIIACLVTAGALVFPKPTVAQAGWYFGSFVCAGFVVVYVISRIAELSGLTTLTGRWDLAPGTLAMALAVGFIAVHTTVLSGINVAHPRRQNWRD